MMNNTQRCGVSTLELTLPRPDDWHLHLRDGPLMSLVLPETAKVFGRALVMPNLKPPIVYAVQALDYRQRILESLSRSKETVTNQCSFTPYHALYLTPYTQPEDIITARKYHEILAIKWYPAGATTNSENGVSEDVLHSEKMQEVIAAMVETELVLSIHGEVVDHDSDIFDREKIFLTRVLKPLLQKWPRLRVVLEHISSQAAAEFVEDYSQTYDLAATITAQHLVFDRNTMLVGGIRPHYYCLPILKRKGDQQALQRIATSGHPAFFLGTDSAPHLQLMKESSCGCAGAYTAPVALSLYAQVFEQADALSRLAQFASKAGANFYRLPINHETITLCKTSWTVPTSYTLSDRIDNVETEQTLIPLCAGQILDWQVN